MNPYDKGVTLRRLDWAADALAWERWRHTSSILAEVNNAHATKESQLVTPDNRNPMSIERKRSPAAGIPHDGNARRAIYEALKTREEKRAKQCRRRLSD